MPARGVSWLRLHCPTCGDEFGDEARREDHDDVLMSMRPMEVVQAPLVYLTCHSGHRWSIKSMTRRMNKPDEILLGVYLGNS